MRAPTAAVVVALLAVTPVAAQTGPGASAPMSAVRFRPYAVVTAEHFTAATTFNATLGSAVQPFFGGGMEVVLRHGVFADVEVMRFSSAGQRVFVDNGQVFPLGIPLRVSLTPIEMTAGYRLRVSGRPRVIPYLGAGVGWYRYRETGAFAGPDENADVTSAGFLLRAGAEVRVMTRLGIAADAQYTSVSGILGQAGVSEIAGEGNLGGVAARVRVIYGR